MTACNAYEELEKRFKRLLILRETSAMLQWDASTMMPLSASSSTSRGEQLATLNRLCHEILTHPEIKDLLYEAKNQDELSRWQLANLREMEHMWKHGNSIPGELVEALSKASMNCESKWRSTRADSDYNSVKPFLQEVLDLVRESASIKSSVFNCPPYEALLDEHSPGLRQNIIDPIFSEIETFIPDFLSSVLEKQAKEPPPMNLNGPFHIKKQEALGRVLMENIGFDFNQGRLDTSLHPFSGGTPEDLRITTRYNTEDFTTGLMGILHETGHALYEKNLPKKWRYQPVGQARGMDIHESQSLLIEMQVCRSREFLAFAVPFMKKILTKEGPEWSADNLYRISTIVKPGLIRVDADEVTYPAHVILRYNIEKALISGDIKLDDLPQAWNHWLSKLIGLVAPDHKNGCMQDIHWFDGAWGYFPSYTFGSILAAQLFQAAKESDSQIASNISKGNFAPLLKWLEKHIHSKGSFFETSDLIEKATGKSLGIQDFKRHLENRYLNINASG